ncbi:hypothetical protein QTP86_002398, partial [Hemibagrus guttatus]
MVMDQLSEEVRQESPWTMMFADDIVTCSESREQVEENLERWRFAVDRRGMKVSRSIAMLYGSETVSLRKRQEPELERVHLEHPEQLHHCLVRKLQRLGSQDPAPFSEEAEKIIGVSLPSIMDIYSTRCIHKAISIVDDPTHPSHTLFTLLPSGKSFLSTSYTGVYWCESESGENSNPVNITVHDGDVILESPVHPVTEGHPLTLRCLYHNPNPSNLRADFYKDGSVLQNQTTGEMIIQTVSKSDEGFYHCKHPERGESPKSWLSVRLLSSQDNGGSNGGTVGLVVGLGFLLMAFLILMILLWSCKRKKGSANIYATVDEAVLCHSSGSSYSREELMNIRATTPVDLFPSFLASTADLLAILIKEARNKVKSRRRGKRSGVLVRLRRRGLRTPLPGIFLSNVRSLCNKMDELTLQMNKNRDFPTSCVLCFTETWLCDAIPDSALQLGGFNLYRADRHTELSGKTKGGGICFYTNNSWCNDVKVLSQLCSPDLEAFIINCKPFYSPREFSSFILVGVYIPPQGNVREAQRALADEIQSVERTNPDALVIVLGDFNKGNLSHELPKYKQFIKCPTREGNVLDHCYTTISGAYRAVPRAALGQSDHIMVHLIPAYRQKLKLCKPVVRTSKKWTSEAVGELQGCLDCTDWDVFRSTTNSLDEYTDTVSSYIYFCEDSIIPTCTRVSYNNDKPWFTAKLRRLRSEKEAAFRSGDRGKYKEAKYRFSEEVRKAKTEHGERMQQQFQTNDSASVWKGLKAITNYKPRAPHSVNDLRLANSLNEYYCRFERQWNSPDPPQSSPHQLSPTQLHTSATPHPPPLTPLTIKEEEVNRLFKRLNTRKATGPDSISPSLLKHCANQLSPVFTDIFNTSLETCHVPACFKTSAIVPVPKKTKITGLNDYRPVALTSVVMKSFERLVLSYLKDITDPLLDPLQFAYRANRSVDDAVNMALHFIIQHLDSPGSYARILFVDFSSAFNTIIPALLRDKLFQLNVPDSMCSWITDFLTDRRQFVRLGTHVSDLQHISTGSPQGCVLSPLLFSLYTNGCTFGHQSVKLLKFADDTTLIGLISDGNESAYRGEIDRLVSWCSTNNLELNSLKTVEMTMDFRKDPAPRPPVILCDSPVSSAESFCFLGTTITKELKWAQNISSLTKKAQQRMYFLRQLKKFLLPVKMLVNFYTAIIESVLTSSITVWFAAATARDKAKLQRVIHSAEKVIGCSLPSLQELYFSRSRRRAAKIAADPSHP